MDMRELRERAKVSKEEAAFKLEVNVGTICNWENGKTEPTIGIIKTSKLLKLYQCSFNDLEKAVQKSKL